MPFVNDVLDGHLIVLLYSRQSVPIIERKGRD